MSTEYTRSTSAAGPSGCPGSSIAELSASFIPPTNA